MRHFGNSLVKSSPTANFVGPTLAQRGSCRLHVGPTWAQRVLLSGVNTWTTHNVSSVNKRPAGGKVNIAGHDVWPGQGATPVRGAPGWLALNPVGGMREPPSGSMQLQKLQFQSVIYGNPEHSNWHQIFPTHIWLFLAQCGMLAGFIKTMQAE